MNSFIIAVVLGTFLSLTIAYGLVYLPGLLSESTTGAPTESETES